MQKWEYQTVFFTSNGYFVQLINDESVPYGKLALTAYLYQAGQEGWEVAGMSSLSEGNAIIIFKRRVG